MSKEQTEREPTLGDNDVTAMGISFKTMLGSGKDGAEFAMSTYIASDLPEEEINSMLDKMQNCINRQRVLGEIPFINEQIAHCEKSIDSVTNGIVAFDQRCEADWNKQSKHGNMKLKQADQEKRNQQMIDLNGWKRDLEIYQEKLRQAQSTLDGSGEVEQERAVKSA